MFFSASFFWPDNHDHEHHEEFLFMNKKIGFADIYRHFSFFVILVEGLMKGFFFFCLANLVCPELQDILQLSISDV